jgi:hypothetical protein
MAAIRRYSSTAWREMPRRRRVFQSTGSDHPQRRTAFCSAAPSSQAPTPHSGAPMTRGLTAKVRSNFSPRNDRVEVRIDQPEAAVILKRTPRRQCFPVN